jgi:hypothetical protein
MVKSRERQNSIFDWDDGRGGRFCYACGLSIVRRWAHRCRKPLLLIRSQDRIDIAVEIGFKGNQFSAIAIGSLPVIDVFINDRFGFGLLIRRQINLILQSEST